MSDAIELYERETAWRSRANRDLLNKVQSFEEAIRDNLGLREQRRLPREIALDVAVCISHHRDISHHF